MRIGISCFSCITRQIERIVMSLSLPHDDGMVILREILSLLSRSDLSLPPPFIARELYNRLHELTGIRDPYASIKARTNNDAMTLLPFVRNVIAAGALPVLEALKISISGNIIDYGTSCDCDISTIKTSLDEAINAPLDEAMFRRFAADADRARSILFIGDNSGEIVFDMALIEQLPRDRITYAVRGNPIINDATREDATYVGLDGMVRVIDTGDNTPGIDFGASSREFLDAFQAADMIVLKGQGNFETVWDVDLRPFAGTGVPVYFLFKVKCQSVARFIRYDVGSIVFSRRET